MGPDFQATRGNDDLTLRRAGTPDLATIVGFLRQMITDMESVGGHPASQSEESWSQIERQAPHRMQDGDRIYLLAESGSEAIGFGEAKCAPSLPVFEPMRILHVSSLYVTPQNRRRGVGKGILKVLLDWGQKNGCSRVELNVLAGNPARNLYRNLGFSEFEVRMGRDL